jgi:hypothetical protein
LLFPSFDLFPFSLSSPANHFYIEKKTTHRTGRKKGIGKEREISKKEKLEKKIQGISFPEEERK